MQEGVDVEYPLDPGEPFPPGFSTHAPPSLDFAHEPSSGNEQQYSSDPSVDFYHVAEDDISRFRDAASCRLQQLQVWFSAELDQAFGAMYHLHEACLKELVHKWDEEHGGGVEGSYEMQASQSLRTEPEPDDEGDAATPSTGSRSKVRESLVVPGTTPEQRLSGAGQRALSSHRGSNRPSLIKDPADLWTGRLSGRPGQRGSRLSGAPPRESARGSILPDEPEPLEVEEPVTMRRKTVAFRGSVMKAEEDLAQKYRSSLVQRSKDRANEDQGDENGHKANGVFPPGAVASNAPPGAAFPAPPDQWGFGPVWNFGHPGAMPLPGGGQGWMALPPGQMPMGPPTPASPAPSWANAGAASQARSMAKARSHHLGAAPGARSDHGMFGLVPNMHGNQFVPGFDSAGRRASSNGSYAQDGSSGPRRSVDEHRLEISPVWTDRKRKTASVGTLRVMAFEAFDDEEDITNITLGEDGYTCMNFLKRSILQPNCVKRLLWDFLGCCFIMYDVIWIPLQLFDPDDSAFTRFMVWAMRVFWTLDIPLSVLTGFMYADGNLEMDVWAIFLRYARTWMILDLVVVAFDWIDAFMVGVGGVGGVRMAKTMRIVRMLRVFRLLRMAKLPIIAGTWLETYVRSEKVLLVGHMIKIMCLIIGTMHFIACIWWGIGNLDNVRANWVTPSLHGDDFVYQYATSFHWSLTQFTGTMEIDPVNISERSFAIFVLLFAFVVSAMFISSITSSMTRLQMISGSKTAMFAALRQYLCDNHISRRLVGRISRNAHHAFEEYQRTTPESEIELLQLVSEPLRVELHFELYAPTLNLNPFFQRYEEANPAAVRRVCHAAVSMTFLSMGDVLFVDGEAPQIPQMWFIIRGSLSYKRQDEHQPRRISVASQVGNWICEPVLWCSWIHCGVLRAESDCRLLVLDAATFQLIAPQFSTSDFQVGLYAAEFVGRLNKHLSDGTLSDIDETKESAATVEAVFNMKATDDTKATKKSFWGNGLSRATKFFGSDRKSGMNRTSVTSSVSHVSSIFEHTTSSHSLT